MQPSAVTEPGVSSAGVDVDATSCTPENGSFLVARVALWISWSKPELRRAKKS